MNTLIYSNIRFLFLTLMCCFSINTVSAATYSVVNVNDSGAGSLRQALLDANANPGPDQVTFNIPGTGPFVIQPLTQLPTITDPITIDGYTQPGSSPATSTTVANLKVVIDGALLGPANGLVLNTDDSLIRGLVINSFKSQNLNFNLGNGLFLLSGSDNNAIKGNYIGVDVTGTTDRGNGFAGVNLLNSNNNLVGGINAEDRNVISGQDTIVVPLAVGNVSGGFNVLIVNGSSFNVVEGNYLGTNAMGTAAIDPTFNATYPNFSSLRGAIARGVGIANTNTTSNTHDNVVRKNLIAGTLDGITSTFGPHHNIIENNLVGTNYTGSAVIGIAEDGIEATASADNLITKNVVAGCLSQQIQISGQILALSPTYNPDRNIVQGNYIGTDVSGTVTLGGRLQGIRLGAGADNNLIEKNTIAFLTRNGITVEGIAVGNKISSNSIYSNGMLGIDLAANGPTANDALDGDSGSNNLQNFPLIDGQKSFINPSMVQVWGSLDSKPNRDYMVEVFASVLADPSGFGEGQVHVGSVQVRTDDNGHADFHFPASMNAPSVNGVKANILTATATDLLTGDTSEFSPWVNVDPKGSPTAYESASGAAGGDHGDSTDSWEY